MILIVGLGNPGRGYADTRHNLGFKVVDRLAARLGGRWHQADGRACAVAEVTLSGQAVLLAKPLRFMNASGGPVARLAKRRNVAAGNVWVVLDDLDLPFGHLRLRPRGSAGGHLGLASILEHLGTEGVPRLRLGVGPNRKPAAFDGARYVLHPFSATERRRLPASLDRATRVLRLALKDGLEAAMTVWNRKGSERLRP